MTSIPRKIPLAIILTIVVAAAGCGGEAKENQAANGTNEAAKTAQAEGPSSRSENKETDTKANAKAESKADEAISRAKESVSKAARKASRKTPKKTAGSKGQPRRVALNLRGDPGTAFSGVCFAGGDRTDFAAKVPQRLVFEPAGKGLRCHIEKRGADNSTLEVVLTTRGERHVQRTNAGQSNIAFTFSRRGFSSHVNSSLSGLGGVSGSSNSIHLRSEQDSSVVTRHFEGEQE